MEEARLNTVAADNMEYLLIDAYNVINAWRDVFDLNAMSLEDCRDKLLHIVSNYGGYMGDDLDIMVVFDAHMVRGARRKGKGAPEPFGNISVVYTRENETADNYIERFVYLNGETNVVRVVTSDFLEQTMILRKGGVRILPRELKQEIMNTALENRHDPFAKRAGGGVTAEAHRRKINTVDANIEGETAARLEKMRRRG
ncbi:MAG: NYN domain-containing protein [Eubacteriales bacterium]|nr:NYN domain-containing protein [Eubacteriales bacterium]